ncbi:MAG: ribbon-helix-helix domain-containing protein [Pseudomonadota bacterium]|nr:ribbon-helix-helix domain-containing protein [Pseudomonadota bacterium]
MDDVNTDGVDPTGIRKRSLRIAGHPTSISLEDAFWRALQDIAARRGVRWADLVAEIDETRTGPNLSSAVRVFVLRQALAGRAGPGPG